MAVVRTACRQGRMSGDDVAAAGTVALIQPIRLSLLEQQDPPPVAFGSRNGPLPVGHERPSQGPD